MDTTPVIFYIFLIFTGASLLATVALYTRQSLIVAYIALGILLGPFGLKWVDDADLIAHIADIGIIFLLFLLGLNLDPKDLIRQLKSTTWITLISSFLFAAIGFCIARLFGFNTFESLVVAGAMMFSSTIIGLKLLPTTVLHHQHMGEVMISILLLQDIIAIMMMLFINAAGGGHTVTTFEMVQMAIALPLLGVICYVLERFVLEKLLARFDKIQEFIFLIAIGWCLGIAELSTSLHLSHEIGAFIAGVAIANGPIALFIAESLKPLRDFFLVLFFFSLGAGFNIAMMDTILLPALVLAGLMLVLKPIIFSFLLRKMHEAKARSTEIGMRLGQVSEFSLLVSYVAHEHHVIGDPVYYLIQTTTIITFVISSYVVVMKYPTPIAISDELRRD